MKLLEEEEKEKREEEERKERRRMKEREKKLRRKERLKGKEKDRDKSCREENQTPDLPQVSKEELPLMVDEEPNNSISCRDSVSEAGYNVLSRPGSPDLQDEQFSNGYIISRLQNPSYDCYDGELSNVKDGIGSFTVEQSKYTRRRSMFWKEVLSDPSMKWPGRRRYIVGPESGAVVNRSEHRCYGDNFETPSRAISSRQLRVNGTKSINRHSGPKFNEKFRCSSNRMSDRYDLNSCSSNENIEYRAKVEPNISTTRAGRETKCVNKSDSALDISKQFCGGNKHNQIDHMRDNCGRSKNKFVSGNNPSGRDLLHQKKVWEPMESQKKYPRSNSDSDVTLKSSAFKVEGTEQRNNLMKSSADTCSGGIGLLSGETDNLKESRNSTIESNLSCQNGLHVNEDVSFNSKEAAFQEIRLRTDCSTTNSVNPAAKGTSESIVCSTSSFDNCSSCLSEGDSNTASSNHGNQESSSISDSEYSSQQSEGKETSVCIQNGHLGCHEVGIDNNQNANGEPMESSTSVGLSQNGAGSYIHGNPPTKDSNGCDNGFSSVTLGSQHQSVLSAMHNQNIHFPVFQAPSTVGYYHQNPVSWPTAPTNGLLPFTHPNQYLYAGPLGYGVNGNSRFCMQYGPMQHLTTPLFAPSPVPIYQPIAKANGMSLEETTQMSKPGAVQEAPNVASSEGIDPGKLHSSQAESGEVAPNDDSGKLHGNSSFSLFHFGGPLDLSTGSESNPVPSKKEEVVGDFRFTSPIDHDENDHHACNKETNVEEYNLFAASNSLRFSFF